MDQKGCGFDLDFLGFVVNFQMVHFTLLQCCPKLMGFSLLPFVCYYLFISQLVTENTFNLNDMKSKGQGKAAKEAVIKNGSMVEVHLFAGQ